MPIISPAMADGCSASCLWLGGAGTRMPLVLGCSVLVDMISSFGLSVPATVGPMHMSVLIAVADHTAWKDSCEE